jgi:hypothetical protein
MYCSFAIYLLLLGASTLFDYYWSGEVITERAITTNTNFIIVIPRSLPNDTLECDSPLHVDGTK